MTEAERRILIAREFISVRLASIEDYFTEPVKVTLIVRNPGHPDGSRDLHMGNDEIELAVAALRRLEADPATIVHERRDGGGL